MSPLARNQNKENSNHQNQEQNMVLINVNCNKPFADDKLASDEIEKDKIEEFYFAEKRYCTVCNVEQPLRSKHCKDCRRCVALYDHHCPWTGLKNVLILFKLFFKEIVLEKKIDVFFILFLYFNYLR